jgi:hypothetical protein
VIYEKVRDPRRHWGYWLTRRGHHFEDEGGRLWTSPREAFWTGRLGMPVNEWLPFGASRHGPSLVEDGLETVRACLAAVGRQHAGHGELATDVFKRDVDAARFHLGWLEGQNLIAEGMLTAEGKAALAMLAMTSPRGPVHDVGDDEMDVRSAAAGDREAVFRRVARIADAQRFRFARMEHGGCAGIELVADAPSRPERKEASLDTGGIVWAQTFGDAEARDRFFLWLCIRLDRWEEWGAFAYARGAHMLSQLLLALLVDAPSGGRPEPMEVGQAVARR